MAKYNIDSLPQMIELGRQGENKARTIKIDCDEMLARWSGAEIVLRAVRPGEETPYIVTTTMDSDGVMTWQPDTTDTAYAGTGRAELRCTVDGKIEKSAMFATCITAALNDVDGDKADAPSSWTQAVLDAADRVTGIGATAVTLDAGADATVTSDGKTLTFGIPRGNDGVSPTVETNQTEGGATVTITDASGTHTLTLSNGAQGIQGERGEQGVQGIQGEKGEKGDKGDTGAQGIQGVQGEKGADGVSPKVTVTQSDDGTVISVTDAEGTTSATVKGGGESVQPDWAQNDSTAKDYIKNRVGGYATKRVYTWDGTVTDDMATITYNGNTFYYAEGLATGDAFSNFSNADLPSEVTFCTSSGHSETMTASTQLISDTGYYLLTCPTYNNMPLAIVSWGASSVTDGVYLFRYTNDTYYNWCGDFELITNIAKIPAKYLSITDEITEGSTEPISSGTIYDMPRLEEDASAIYKWDGTTSDTGTITYNDITYYPLDPVKTTWSGNTDANILRSDLPTSIKYSYNANGTINTWSYEPTITDITIDSTEYWGMSWDFNRNNSDPLVLIPKTLVYTNWVNDIHQASPIYVARRDHSYAGYTAWLSYLRLSRPIALPTGFIPTTDTATSGSTTPITSGGVYTALQALETRIAALESKSTT